MKPSVLILAAGILSFLSCEFPTGNDYSPETDPGDTGTLEIRFGDVTQTILPSVDMNTSYYIVEGDGPDSNSFELRIESGGQGRTQEVVPGSWTLTALAYNSNSQLIGRGNTSVDVVGGRRTSARITVKQLSGNGAVDFTIFWPAGEVEEPEVMAALTPESGQEITLQPDNDIRSGSAHFALNVPVGYYALSVRLIDDESRTVGGFSEVIWIVKDTTTSFTYTFDPEGSGTFSGVIDNDVNKTIPVQIVNIPEPFARPDKAYTVSAGVPEEIEVEYHWFLDGRKVGTGSTYRLKDLSPGYHTISVIVFSSSGSRAGSHNDTFEVRPYELSISPSRISLEINRNQAFQVSGGYPPYEYRAGSGTIRDGFYTAPGAAGTDSVTVTDQSNNSVQAVITITDPPVSDGPVQVFFAGGQSNAKRVWADAIRDELASLTRKTILLVHINHTGEAIERWYTTRKRDFYFTDFFDGGGNGTLQKAISDLKKQNKEYEFAGFFWFQGESDLWMGEYQYYRQRFEDMLAALRSDLKISTFPFHLAIIDLNDAPEYDDYSIGYDRDDVNALRAIQMEIANASASGLYTDTRGIPRVDAWHPTDSDLRKLGERMATQFYNRFY